MLKVCPTRRQGVYLIEPQVCTDSRGCFTEIWQADRYWSLMQAVFGSTPPPWRESLHDCIQEFSTCTSIPLVTS